MEDKKFKSNGVYVAYVNEFSIPGFENNNKGLSGIFKGKNTFICMLHFRKNKAAETYEVSVRYKVSNEPIDLFKQVDYAENSIEQKEAEYISIKSDSYISFESEGYRYAGIFTNFIEVIALRISIKKNLTVDELVAKRDPPPSPFAFRFIPFCMHI